jgi:hypothetical protein
VALAVLHVRGDANAPKFWVATAETQRVTGAEALGPLGLGLFAAAAGAAVIGGAQAVTYTASVFYSLDFDDKRGLGGSCEAGSPPAGQAV